MLLDDVDLRDQLLRQRGTALDDVPGGNVAHDRAGDSLWVNAAVLIEAAVLDGHGALFHPRRDLVGIDGLAVFVVREDTEALAVIGVDSAVRANLTCLDGVERG